MPACIFLFPMGVEVQVNGEKQNYSLTSHMIYSGFPCSWAQHHYLPCLLTVQTSGHGLREHPHRPQDSILYSILFVLKKK